jgi:proteasome lid subunit RPN8/RPN11
VTDVRVDVGQIDVRPLQEKAFPGEQGFRICIARDAHDAVWNHARESVAATARQGPSEIVEVGGVLIGNVYRDRVGPFLEITAAIAGEHTRNQGTQMTFTPETWAHVNRVKDQRYRDSLIVGWYHTHPRFGIFLSDMDKFIQRSHFQQPWTTAFVVDPIRQSEGFFVWNDGDPSPASEYWVGRERRETVRRGAVPPAEMIDPNQGGLPPSDSTVSRASFALATVLGFLGLLFLFGFVYMREVSHAERERLVLGVVDAQKTELSDTVRALTVLRDQFDASTTRTTETEERIRQRIEEVRVRLVRIAVLAEKLSRQLTAQQEILDRLRQNDPDAVQPDGRPNQERSKQP